MSAVIIFGLCLGLSAFASTAFVAAFSLSARIEEDEFVERLLVSKSSSCDAHHREACPPPGSSPRFRISPMPRDIKSRRQAA